MIFEKVFVILICFPYLKLFGIGMRTDIQIYGFLMGVIVLIINFKKLKFGNNCKNDCIHLFICVLILFVVNKKMDLRGIFCYVSLIIIFLVGNGLTLTKQKILKLLKINYFIWSFVGCIQYFDNSLLLFWRDKFIIKGGRGSISLATEPAYFSIQLILLTLIILKLERKSKKYSLITLFISLIISKSAVGLLYSFILVLIIYKNKIKRNKIKYSLLLILFLGGLSIFIYFNQDSRIVKLMSKVIDNPIALIRNDGSLGIRIAHFYLGILGSIENYLLPNGTINFGEYYFYKVKEYFYIFYWSKYIKKSIINKNVSMLSGFIYELGVFSILIFRVLCRNLKYKEVSFYIILVMGLNGLNLTNPLFPFLLAIYGRRK
ncbi:MAG: hypothetical protein RSA05_06460 [Cetobacterium sp.]